MNCFFSWEFINNFSAHMSKAKAPEPKRPDPKQADASKTQIKRETDVDKYLRQLSSKTQSIDKIMKSALAEENGVVKSIKKGKLEVKQIPTNLTALLHVEQVNQEEIKAMELKRKRDQILEAIQNLDMRIHKTQNPNKLIAKQYSNPDLLNYKPNSVLSKQQHQAMVLKMRKAQQSQDQRNEERLYQLQKDLKEQNEKCNKMQQDKKNQQKQLRRRQSEYKLSVRKQIIELQNAEQQRSKKQITQLKRKSQVHQIMQQKYNNTITIPGLQEKKKKLKEIREINKSFKLKDINEHQKLYIKQRNKSMNLFNSKLRVSEEWTYKPPQKTDKLSKILQDQLSDQKKQLEKHQKAIEQKILRQQNYIRLLKQKHIPKIDTNKQAELIQRLQQIHTKKRQPKQDAKQIGKRNLIQAKKLKKNVSESAIKPENEVVETVPQLQSSRVNYLMRNESTEYYSQKRNENLKKIMDSQNTVAEKTHQMQIQNFKINEALARKQKLLKLKGGSVADRKDTAQLLLSGIQAKLGLIKLAP